jgi:hypothetical protein
MNLITSFRSFVSTLFRRSKIASEVEEELRSHILHRADDLERSGLSRPEAERRARIEFGGYQRYKQESHEARGGQLLESFLEDLSFSLRKLRKSPGFTFAAVLTLALAIGANAVVFSMFNGLLLRQLNVPQERSLYALQRGNNTYIVQSYPDYIDLRDRNRTFDGLVAYTIAQVGLDTGEDASSPWLYEVSGNYFDALRLSNSAMPAEDVDGFDGADGGFHHAGVTDHVGVGERRCVPRVDRSAGSQGARRCADA